MKKLLPPLTVSIWLFMGSRVSAHGVGEVYASPIPVNYYLFGSAIAVGVSFVLFTLFRNKHTENSNRERVIRAAWLPKLIVTAKALTLLLLLTIIFTGIFGEQQPSLNFGPVYFWIFFLLGYSILSVLVGNIWQQISPFKTVSDLLKLKAGPKGPVKTVYWWLPAVLLLALFWWELLSGFSYVPQYVGGVLLVYTLANPYLATIYKDWHTKGEVFAALFNTLGNMAYVRVGDDEKSLVVTKPARRSADKIATKATLLITSVLLAAASFDSVRETVIWSDLLRSLGVASSQGTLLANTLGLALSPLPFLFAFLISVRIMQKLTGNVLDWRELAKRFTWSLLPIAFGYTLAHNFALSITSTPAMLGALSDPFGWGWNLFGTASLRDLPLLLGAKVIWFIEIVFVVLAHVVGVWFAHVIALRTFSNRREIARSQYPMVVLMLAFTIMTLWLLSQVIVAD